MRLFWKKQSTNTVAEEQRKKRINVEFDSSILRKRNHTSFYRRDGRSLVAIKITPELEKPNRK